LNSGCRVWSESLAAAQSKVSVGFLRKADSGLTRMITLISAQLMDFFRDTDTSFSELRDTLRTPGQVTPFETIVARAVGCGELPDVRRSSRVVNHPLNLFRHDVLMTLRSLPDE
jgi:hypothetical protein